MSIFIVQLGTPRKPGEGLRLGAEDFPVFSSLPPGDLPAGTPLATGTIAPATGASLTAASIKQK